MRSVRVRRHVNSLESPEVNVARTLFQSEAFDGGAMPLETVRETPPASEPAQAPSSDEAPTADFAKMISTKVHDINQPLAVIRMASESLLEELELAETEAIRPALRDFLTKKIERITAQSVRASELIGELRAYVRKPAAPPAE